MNEETQRKITFIIIGLVLIYYGIFVRNFDFIGFTIIALGAFLGWMGLPEKWLDKITKRKEEKK